ncbi:zinc knuckle [Cooperia oncophora]
MWTIRRCRRRRLKKHGGVTEFCLELERLSREAYPDASEEELSRTRAGELVSQLTDWPEYLQLFTTMEIAPKEQAYDMVKAMAQRCERSKQVAAAMRNAMEGHARKSQDGRLRKVDRSHDARQVQNTVNTLEGGSSKLDVRDATAQRRPVGKCFNCNKQGHLRKDCTMPKKNATVTEKVTKSAQQAEPARIFTASLRKWICGAVEVDNKHFTQSVVGHWVANQHHTTASTPGSIGVRFDLDADVEEIPLDQQKQVFDASGNRMSFKGAIRLTLQMSDGQSRSVPIQCTDVVWEGGEKAVEVPVTNTFAGAKIFRLGEEVGILEPAKVVEVKPVTYSGDMLGRTVEAPTDREDRLLKLLRDNRTNAENSEEVENLVKSYAQVFANPGLRSDLLVQLLLSKLGDHPDAMAKAPVRHVRGENASNLVDASRQKFEVNDDTTSEGIH